MSPVSYTHLDVYKRQIYTNISANHFTWIGDHSVDGKSWTEFMRIECQRTKK